MTHIMWHLTSLARQPRTGGMEVPGGNLSSSAGGESSRKEHTCSDDTGVQELQHPLQGASGLLLARKWMCQHSREFPGVSIMPVQVMQSFHCLVNKPNPLGFTVTKKILSTLQGDEHNPSKTLMQLSNPLKIESLGMCSFEGVLRL